MPHLSRTSLRNGVESAVMSRAATMVSKKLGTGKEDVGWKRMTKLKLRTARKNEVELF